MTTRSKSKKDTHTPYGKDRVSPGKFLRKNSGKKDYKPKSRKRPVKPSQKPKKIKNLPRLMKNILKKSELEIKLRY